MRVVSSSAIGRMAEAAGVPYSTLERTTRPLKEANRWPHRTNPDMQPAYLACLIAAFAAQLPSDAMRAVEAVETLSYDGMDEGDGIVTPTEGETCIRWEAFFPLYGNTGPVPWRLLDFISTMIQGLMEMEDGGRNALAARLKDADWTLAICLDPCFASMSWYEQAAPGAFGMIDPDIIDPEILAAMAAGKQPKATRKRVSMRFWRAENDLRPRAKARGVERLVWIPFSVLVTAAEICLEARQRTTSGGLPLPNLVPGRTDDEDQGDTAGPDTMKAAGPGSHDGLSSKGQPELSPAGYEPANELPFELDSEQCSDRRCPTQRLV